MSPGIEFNAHIADIPVYPAASTYQFEGELVKLASNETPFAPHPQVLEAVESGLRNLNRYPDPAKSALRKRLSERTGVAAGRIAIGNGSCELLLAAADAMLEPGTEIVYAWPSFSIYPHMSAMSGARAVTVPLNEAVSPFPVRSRSTGAVPPPAQFAVPCRFPDWRRSFPLDPPLRSMN